MEVLDHPLVGVVAQQSFEVQSAGDSYNSFCTIQPIAFQNGLRTEPDDFPNNGLVWWMLRPNAHRFTHPGQLVAFSVENAIDPKKDDPSGNLYQVIRASVEACALDDIVEIVTVPATSARRANDLVSRRNILTLDHPPCGLVLVRWKDHVYGPLRAESIADNQPDRFQLSFEAPSPGQPVSRFTNAQIDSVSSPSERSFHVQVALDAQVRDKSRDLAVCKYELLSTTAYELLTTNAEDRVLLESDSEVLRRAAKGVLTRKRRQDLIALLKELEDGLAKTGDANSDEQTQEILEQVTRALESGARQIDSLAGSLLDSGLLDERLNSAISERVEQHLESRAATL